MKALGIFKATGGPHALQGRRGPQRRQNLKRTHRERWQVYPKIGYIFNGVAERGLVPVAPATPALATGTDDSDLPF